MPVQWLILHWNWRAVIPSWDLTSSLCMRLPCYTISEYSLLMRHAFIAMVPNNIYAMAIWVRSCCDRLVMNAMPVYVSVTQEQALQKM